MAKNENELRIKDYLEKLNLNLPIPKNEKIFDEGEYIKCELEIKTKPELNKLCDSYYGYCIKETKECWIVEVLLPRSGELYFDEYDRSEDAFNLFESICDNKLTQKNGAWIYEYGKNETIPISGDIDINFKMRTLHSWFEIIDNDSKYKGDKNSIKVKLWAYHSMAYFDR